MLCILLMFIDLVSILEIVIILTYGDWSWVAALFENLNPSWFGFFNYLTSCSAWHDLYTIFLHLHCRHISSGRYCLKGFSTPPIIQIKVLGTLACLYEILKRGLRILPCVAALVKIYHIDISFFTSFSDRHLFLLLRCQILLLLLFRWSKQFWAWLPRIFTPELVGTECCF